MADVHATSDGGGFVEKYGTSVVLSQSYMRQLDRHKKNIGLSSVARKELIDVPLLCQHVDGQIVGMSLAQIAEVIQQVFVLATKTAPAETCRSIKMKVGIDLKK